MPPTPAYAGLRPGGRSARVQAAVHQAVQQLQSELGRAALTVPLIAQRAQVTPSTIYRRWGDLADLLADVAAEHLRPEGEPMSTGSVAGDLQAWAAQYADEMASPVGVAMVRDVLSGSSSTGADVPCRCSAYTADQIERILQRGRDRGETVPAVDAVIDALVAPVIYRALFGPSVWTARETGAAVARLCGQTQGPAGDKGDSDRKPRRSSTARQVRVRKAAGAPRA